MDNDLCCILHAQLKDEDSDNLMEDHNITLRLNASVEQFDGDMVCAVGFYLDETLPACIPHCQSWLNITMADTIIYISLMILIFKSFSTEKV